VTIIRDTHINLKSENVFRREGLSQPGSSKVKIISLIEELLLLIKDDHLLETAIVYETQPIIGINRHRLVLKNVTLNSPLFARMIPDAKELAVVCCTIGPKLENVVTEYLGKNEALRGMLLDGIGNAAIDTLAQEACRNIAEVALTYGFQTSSPLSPGTSYFPITEQKKIFHLISSEQIGLKLSPAGMMVPRKSISMIIGIGPMMKVWTQAEVCANCNLARTCLYRYGK
jgi:hypothetical protein